jgi:outer membrane biosynthesis protein TonB
MATPNDPKGARPTSVARWNAAVHETGAVGPERVLAMTDAEVDRALTASGVSKADADAEADAFLATLRKRAATKPAPEPVAEDGAWVRSTETANTGRASRPRRSRSTYIAVGVAAAAAVGGATYLATRPPPEPPKRDEPVPPPTVTVTPIPAPAPAPAPAPSPTPVVPPVEKATENKKGR